MNATRRSFLKFFGGATAGVMLSPLPWKLLDDVSIWTQNWSWMATPPRGAVSWRTTTCTLCPAGCGLKVRCIGDHPVSAWAVANHPLSAGTACPAGFAAAQLPYHPVRIRGAVTRGRGATDKWKLVDANTAAEETGRLVARIRESGNASRIAILDPRPGRAISLQYREFLTEAGGGRYLTLPDSRESGSAALGDLLDLSGLVPAYDLERAGAVISFGAPVFDGWRGAAPAPGLLSDSDSRLHTIQVVTNGSRDTDQADLWLPVRPGAEAALAIGLARMVREETGGTNATNVSKTDPAFLSVWNEQLAAHTPERTAEATGIGADVLRRAARELVAHGPAVALGGGNTVAGALGRGEELAIWGLNRELGAIDRPGGVTLRRDAAAIFGETPVSAQPLNEVPDGSLDLLLVDGALPSALVPAGMLRRKMRGPEARIVAFSAYAAGPSAEADFILPAAAPGEWLDDVPARAQAFAASYALAPAVFKSPVPALHPADALAAIARAASFEGAGAGGHAAHEAALDRRLDALLAAGSGQVFVAKSNTTKSVAAFSSRRKLEKALSAGGCWSEAPAIGAAAWSLRDAETARRELAEAAAGRLPKTDSSRPLAVVAAGPAVAAGGGALPTALTKLYRESNLMSSAGMARVNPATGRERTLRDGKQARLETEHGKATVIVVHDEAVMPGVVLVSPGPDPVNLGDPDALDGNILEICGAADRPVWRVTAAALREV